jgi:hypothetical protein
VNQDVPEEVVRVLMDHDSTAMTAHYARLHDQTVRKHWERARKVNCKGDDVKLEPDSPLADAHWSNTAWGLPPRRCPTATGACPYSGAARTLTGSYVTPEGRKRPSTCRNTAQMSTGCSQKELLPHSVLRWDQPPTVAKGAQKVTQTGLM